MKAQPVSRISAPDLNRLMAQLEVEVQALSECLVSPGFSLSLGGNPAPGIHYILQGEGRMSLRGATPIDVGPHTLIIVPPDCPVVLEAPAGESVQATALCVDGRLQQTTIDGVRRYTAGADEPRTLMICGFFRATYGASTGLFEGLDAPIVERFDKSDRLDEKLKAAFTELLAQEIGAGAMGGALLKQVIVALLRRSLSSVNAWVERFAMLSDQQVARAFSRMVANPGGTHTVASLADAAHLSRSAFMARFASVVGKPPMLVLRDLRMRQAAAQLGAGSYTIDQVVHNAGYASRSSFVRAFRAVFDTDPSGYRAT